MYPLIKRIFTYRKVRYLFSGSIGASVHVGTVYLLTHILNEWYLYATLIGFLCAFGVSFMLQKFFTFGDHRIHTLPLQSSIFFLVSSTNFFINGVLMFLFVEKIGLFPAPAQIASSLILAIWSYLIYARLFRINA